MTHAPRPLVAGNWKMNVLREAGDALARAIVERWQVAKPRNAELVLCPPATLLSTVGEALEKSGILLGAQDCHWEAEGAHTGDISAPMLIDLGCRFVILGHSERRAAYGETDRQIAAKVGAAQAAGLKTIVCVGERAAEHDANKTAAIVESQLLSSLPEGISAKDTMIAYEPVWAIGSGKTPSVDEIGSVHERIRAFLNERFQPEAAFPILYGGSVTASNAAEILAIQEVNGALVGGASFDAEAFCAIAESCG